MTTILPTLFPVFSVDSVSLEIDNTSAYGHVSSMANISYNETHVDVPHSSHHNNEDRFMDFWVDGVFKLFIGGLGISMNTIGIWILITQQRMQNMFLHILTCSLVFDNAYMAMEMLSTLYHEFKITFLVWILPQVVYPFKEIFYTCNILVTIGLSYERFTLISDKKGYKQTMEVARFRHQRLRKYVIAISLFSIIFNLPSFFTHYVNLEELNTSKTEVYRNNKKTWRILDRAIKWTIFLLGCFVILVFYNWKVFRNIKSKLQTRHELKSLNTTDQTKSESVKELLAPEKNFRARINMLRKLRRKEKYTTALFALVSAFFFCNIWFFGEVILKAVKSTITSGNFDVFVDNYEIIARLMRMLNSCTNIFIYCVVDRAFRNLFKNYLKRLAYLMTCTLFKSLNQPDQFRESSIQDTSHSEHLSRPLSSKRTTLNNRDIENKSVL